MFELSFFRDSYESTWAAATVFDIVKTTLVIYLSMETGYIFINDVNFIFRVASDHSAMFLEGVTAKNSRLTLFYDELINLSLFAF